MKKRFLSIALAMISTLALAFSGCNGKGGDELDLNGKKVPDYSDSTLQFDFYGYSAASNGEWTIDGVKYSAGQDFRTVERIKEYKDAGMTIYFPQHQAYYNGQDFETSQTKKAFEDALEAGIDKVIINDTRIQSLSKPAEKDAVGLIGEGKQFATEEDLDALIAEYMAPYKDHEAFYGLMLGDEPFCYHAENYGQIYRSIKRVCPDAYIQYNLNPITAGTGMNANGKRNIDVRFPELKEGDEGYGAEKDSQEELIARYKAYIRLFMDKTGAKYIQYDQYPFRSASKADEYYLLGLQVVSELVKEYDAEFYFVTQTYGQQEGALGNPRMLSEADLYWLNNMLVGFGIKQISYFTYWTKSDNNTEHFIDGNSFITWYGEKTNIYYWMQKIMAEEQKFAPTVLNFDYQTSKVYMVQPTIFNAGYALRTIDTADFQAVTSVEVNKEVALVTELYDNVKGYYMYMIQNIVDSVNKGSKAFQTTTVTFDEDYTHAVVYVKGEKTVKKLDEGKLVVKHKPGEATYVIPF